MKAILEVVFVALASTCGVYSQELRGGVTGKKVQTGKIARVEVAGGFFPSSASPDDEENDYDFKGEEVMLGKSCKVKRGEKAKKKCGKNMYCETNGCPKKGKSKKGKCASLKCNFMAGMGEVCGCNGKRYRNPIHACENGVNVGRCPGSEEGIKLFVDGEWDGSEDAEWDKEGEDDSEDMDDSKDEDDSEDENDDDEDDEDEGGQTNEKCVVLNQDCDQNAPHFDPQGMVCANDGQEDEAYCNYSFGPTACVIGCSEPVEEAVMVF